MFIRSILIPSLIVCAIAAPIMFSQANKRAAPVDAQTGFAIQAGYADSGNTSLPSAQLNNRFSTPFQPSGSAIYPTTPNRDPIFPQANTFGNPAQPPIATNLSSMGYPGSPSQIPVSKGLPALNESNLGGMRMLPATSPTLDNQFKGMTPDYGATQTLIYPGDANGPNLTAEPLEFMPVTSFEEIFRFDVSSEWIMSRWKRVSTVAGASGLHGLRVALVTGTNSWDLHGSLTYYFDANQRPQRITFRGWAGDAKKLTDFLTQRYDFKSQPTQWAGFHLAKKIRRETGGALMQHPTVIYRDNPIQQVAVVMEINDPKGSFALSDEFQSLIAGSKSAR